MFDKSLLKRAIDALDACTTDEGPESFELSASRKILAELRAAHAACLAPAEPPAITLSGAQLLEALDFVAPDRDGPDQLDQLESEVCISYRPAGIDTDGDPFEAGMCCWLSDYPEEGSIPLPGLIPTAPLAPAEPIRATYGMGLSEKWPYPVAAPVAPASDAVALARILQSNIGGTRDFSGLDADQKALWDRCQRVIDAPTAPAAPAEQTTDSEPHEKPGDLLAWGSTAVLDVAAERRRQIEVEGWTPEHDDEHGDGSMSIAAACYALANRPALEVQTVKLHDLWLWTGWAASWFKPRDQRQNLVRAGALILAEIERLDRSGKDASA